MFQIMPSEKRKAKKQNYFKAVKQSRKYSQGKVLKEDMVGFLLTCNNREKEAVREGYNLLNEFADKSIGPEITQGNEEVEDLECDDIDNAFDKEKENLDELKSKSFSERRFQQVESGANNCIFIKTTIEDPVKLTTDIIEDISVSKTQKARYTLRMIPILGTCKAYDKNMEELAEQVLSKAIKEDSELTYSILFKARNNNKVFRDDTIKLMGGVVRKVAGKTSVDLKTPNFCVVVEIIRTVCCIGVVWNYFGRKKYNLVELAKPDEDPAVIKDEEKEEITKEEKNDNLENDEEKLELEKHNKLEIKRTDGDHENVE